MIYLIFGILVVVCIAATVIECRPVYDSVAGAIAVASGCLAALVGVLCLFWYESAVEARVINERFGTHYTQSDIFWAGESVKMSLQVDEQKIKVTQ